MQCSKKCKTGYHGFNPPNDIWFSFHKAQSTNYTMKSITHKCEMKLSDPLLVQDEGTPEGPRLCVTPNLPSVLSLGFRRGSEQGFKQHLWKKKVHRGCQGCIQKWNLQKSLLYFTSHSVHLRFKSMLSLCLISLGSALTFILWYRGVKHNTCPKQMKIQLRNI